ncbi:MAG: 50S ribosomal protein L29 [Anaerolineae bacterium]|jgi:large subunit ribosomal protein L29|nr:MAG: 50S ribosomal protein L29 [Anaerolineae bacterium]
MTTAREIRQLTESEIKEKLDEAKEELFKLRFQKSTGQLENTARLRVVRREVARIKTVLRERQLAAQIVQEEKNA